MWRSDLVLPTCQPSLSFSFMWIIFVAAGVPRPVFPTSLSYVLLEQWLASHGLQAGLLLIGTWPHPVDGVLPTVAFSLRRQNQVVVTHLMAHEPNTFPLWPCKKNLADPCSRIGGLAPSEDSRLPPVQYFVF